MCGSEREGMTPNDSLWELLLMVHAAKHASAHRIIAVTPWYGYSRQDKKSAPREPISARLVADTLEVAGIDRLVTMDLHAGQLQGFFSKPVDHMTAMPILTQFVIDRLGNENLVIIAPDAGRVKLVRKFAQKVGAPYALMEKERPAQQVAEIGYVIGDVKGKTAVIVDDIIGTGSTLSAAAQTVLDEGAERVFAVATHGLFSGNAFENLEQRTAGRHRRHRHGPAPRGRPGPDHPAHLRRHPRGLDPPHLHRRLGLRDLRRREPAVLTPRLYAVRAVSRHPGRAVREDDSSGLPAVTAAGAPVVLGISVAGRTRVVHATGREFLASGADVERLASVSPRRLVVHSVQRASCF